MPSAHAPMKPAWSVYAWPPVLWQADRALELHFRHLGTRVLDSGHKIFPSSGQTLWAMPSSDGEAGMAWDWVMLSQGVVAMADPLSVITNLRLLDRVARERRKRKRTWLVAAAAAVVLIVAGPLVTWNVLGSDPWAPWTTSRELSARQGEVWANLEVDGVPWGTGVRLELGGVTGPLTCGLYAVTKSGETRAMMDWTVPPYGYGVPSQPKPLVASGMPAGPVYSSWSRCSRRVSPSGWISQSMAVTGRPRGWRKEESAAGKGERVTRPPLTLSSRATSCRQCATASPL